MFLYGVFYQVLLCYSIQKYVFCLTHSLSYNIYFIAVNDQGQEIIGLTKKIVTTHVVGELKVLI